MQLRRIFLFGTVTLVSVAALVAIVAVLGGSFGSTEGKIFATIAATFVAGSAVVAGVALIERGAARPLGYAGVVLATCGFVLWTEEIWAGHDSDAYWKVLGLVLTWSLALLLVTAARLMTRSPRLLRTLYRATAAAAAGAALVASVLILRENGDGWQLFAVLLILSVLGETLTPILERVAAVPEEGRAAQERVLGRVPGAVVVAVRSSAGQSLVVVGTREFRLGPDEHVAVRPT
jgi:hypothetical protein